MKNKTNTYDANFTAGGLLLNEFRSLKNILLGEDFNANLIKEQQENLMIGIATMSARKRIVSEIKRRSALAPIGFWNHFFQWDEMEMKLGLLYLCLKTYPLIMDIHIEVALKKFKIGNTMNAYDIQMRIDEIGSKDDYVAQWSTSTFEKINVQYRKSIKDAGLYDGIHLVRPNKIAPIFWKYFEEINEGWFVSACFMKN